MPESKGFEIPDPTESALLGKGKNYLLAIGIDQYQHVGKLSNAVRDARMVGELLEESYGFDDRQLLFDEEATRRGIRTLLKDQIGRVGEKDNLVIYFSGHGHYDKVIKEAYWVPVDARFGDDTDYVSYDYIQKSIRAMKAHHIFLIVDSCYSGAIMVRKRDEPLERFEKDPSRWILASGRNEVVPDGISGENSPFATQLIDVLTRYSGEGIRVSELVNKVTTAVIHDSYQTPIGRPLFQVGDKGGEFVFRRRKQRIQAKEDLLQKDLSAWNKAKAEHSIKGYEAYLAALSEGEFRELAESRIAQLSAFSKRDKDIAAWKKAKEQKSVEGYTAYLREFPEGEFAFLAEKALERVRKKHASLKEESHRKEKLRAYIEEGEEMMQESDYEGALKCWEEALAITTEKERKGVEEQISAAKTKIAQASPKTHPLLQELGIEMIPVEGGTFRMGSDDYDDEQPIHEVRLSSFEIGKFPITQAQWQKVMGSNPSNFKDSPKHPVETVSWEAVKEFIDKINQQSGQKFSLPTEAQWEFAAKGGNNSKGFRFSGSDKLEEVGWFRDNSQKTSHPVGQKKANELGIYDLSGNVWEWCEDRYAKDYYSNSPMRNPKGPQNGRARVLRGGSWVSGAIGCRVSNRFNDDPSGRPGYIGFRLARTP